MYSTHYSIRSLKEPRVVNLHFKFCFFWLCRSCLEEKKTAIRYIGGSKNARHITHTVDTITNTKTKMVCDNQRNNSNSNSNSISNKNKCSSSSSSSHTGFTSSRVLILLGCLICLAFGLNVYLSILHDPTKTKNSNVEPIVDALLLKNNNITSIKKLEVDDDLIQAITTITAVKTKTKVKKVKNEASSTNSTNGNGNGNGNGTSPLRICHRFNFNTLLLIVPR